MEGAMAATAESGWPAPEGAEGGVPQVTAQAFRQLTARLLAARAPPPPPPTVSPAAAAIILPAPAADEMPMSGAEAEALAEAVPDALPSRPPREAGDEAGDTAISLIELMATISGLLPQERALAADTLLLLLPRLPGRQLTRLAERVAIMDSPPPLLVAKLIRDPRPEVMGPVLERNAQLCDRDMIEATGREDAERLRIIARRRVLSPVLSGHIVSFGDPEVILILLRNAGAQLPHWAFDRLARLAVAHPQLLAPLATRPDLPAAVAFELFWSLPPELRRLLLSRFLTDSVTLGNILRIALSEDESLPGGALREDRPAPPEALDAALDAASALRMEEAALRFGELAGIADGTVRRILGDRQGEPAAVLFKALGVSRVRFLEALERLGPGMALEGDPQDLQALFDGLSFTKARMLLTYWDWQVRRTGPYAPGN
jgi:uncharacterized protein (DUF2336 family)